MSLESNQTTSASIESPVLQTSRCVPPPLPLTLSRSAQLRSIPSEEEEYEQPGASSFCDSSEPSFLERMSHVLEDPLPPGHVSLTNTPRQRKQARISTASSSIRFATDYRMESSLWSPDRRQYPSERSSLRSPLPPHVLSPLSSAPPRASIIPDTSRTTAAVSTSPPRPARKCSTASDVSPSIVEALVGAYSSQPSTLERPSTFCIATPRQPRLRRDFLHLNKDDSISSVASTVAVATPSAEASPLSSALQEFPKLLSASITKLDGKGGRILKVLILFNILVLLFTAYTYHEVQSEIASMKNVLTRMELQLYMQTRSISEATYVAPPVTAPDVYEATMQSTPIATSASTSMPEKTPKAPLKKGPKIFAWFRRLFGQGVPLRIRPRKRAIYLSSNRDHKFSLLKTAFLFSCFLCKIVMAFVASFLIRTALFASLTIVFIAGVFRVNLFRVIRNTPWITLLTLMRTSLAQSPTVSNTSAKSGKQQSRDRHNYAA